MELIWHKDLQEFNSLYKQLDDLYHELGVHIGLSDTAFLILYTMVETGGKCLQRDVAGLYALSPQTVNSAAKNLEKKGLLGLAPGEGRNKRLYLTPQGERFVDDRLRPIIELENSVFSGMNAEESREFLRLTRKYVTLFRGRVEQYLRAAPENGRPEEPSP